MSAVDMTGATAEDYAEQDVLDELERASAKTTTPEQLAGAASGAPSGVVPSSPPDVESSPPPSGGESTTPIWDELADRWAALQPLLARSANEEAADG